MQPISVDCRNRKANKRTFNCLNPARMPKREDFAETQKCPQWIERFSNRDKGYPIQEFSAQEFLLLNSRFSTDDHFMHICGLI